LDGELKIDETTKAAPEEKQSEKPKKA